MTEKKPKPKLVQPEIYRPPTPEERERDRREVEEFVARAKAGEDIERLAAGAGARAYLNPADTKTHGEPIEQVADQALAALRRWDAERRQLVCHLAMYPRGAPDDYLAVQREHPELVVGKAACEEAGVWKDCRYAEQGDFCPRVLVDRLRLETHKRLTTGKVEEQEYDLIMAALQPVKPVALKPTDALRVMRQRLSRKRGEVTLDNAAEVEPLGGKTTTGRVLITGSERVMIFAGNTGRGKTVAGAYAIARIGGLYLTEYELARPKRGFVDEVKRHAGVLVIDQVGRAPVDDRRSVIAAVEEVVDRRYAAHLTTVLIGNVSYQEFMARYQKIILERVAGDGVFVLFGGQSLRPALRGVQ